MAEQFPGTGYPPDSQTVLLRKLVNNTALIAQTGSGGGIGAFTYLTTSGNGTLGALEMAASTSSDGGLSFGADTNLYRSAADTLKTDDAFDATGKITTDDTTQATTTTDGSLQTDGGLSVVKDAVIGGDITATGAVTGSNLSGTNTGDQTLPTRASLGLATTDDVSFNGVNVSANSAFEVAEINLTAYQVVGPSAYTSNIKSDHDGKMTIKAGNGYLTLEATQGSSIAFTLDDYSGSGAAPIAYLTNAPLVMNDATQSTSTTTGSLKLAGGLGVVKDVFIGGNVNLSDGKKFTALGNGIATNVFETGRSGNTNPRLSISANGLLAWGSGSGSEDTFLYRSAANILKTDHAFDATGKITTDDTTQATTATDGSLQTDGGLSVVKDAYLSGTITVAKVAGNTSSTTRMVFANSGTQTATANSTAIVGLGVSQSFQTGGFSSVALKGAELVMSWGGAGTGTGHGIRAVVSHGSGGSAMSALYGGEFSALSFLSSGSITDLFGVKSTVGALASTATITNLYGLYVDYQFSGTITNAYGVYVEDIVSASNNYALYTGAGLVRFGDDVSSTGRITTDDTTQATTTTDGSLQTDGGLSVVKDAVIGGTLTPVGRLELPMGEINYFNLTGTTIAIVSASTTGLDNTVKFGGATALTAGGYEFDNGGADNGRLRYTGATTRMFHVAGSVSFSGGNSDTFTIMFAKNGTVVSTSSVAMRKMGTGGDVGSTAIHGFVTLATNDYLEVNFGNLTDADDPTVHSLNVFAMGM